MIISIMFTAKNASTIIFIFMLRESVMYVFVSSLIIRKPMKINSRNAVISELFVSGSEIKNHIALMIVIFSEISKLFFGLVFSDIRKIEKAPIMINTKPILKF